MSLEERSEEELEGLQKAFLNKLESMQKERGSDFVGNVSLLGELAWPADLYWSVRDRLLNAGHVQLGRGKGGSVHRVVTTPAEVPPGEGPAPQETAEHQLYEPLAKALREGWVKSSRFRQSIVEITARQGRRETGGRWSRPDLAVIGFTTYVYVPGRHFDVVTFEVKPTSAIDVTAVYEALAHRRAATRSYVVLHVPEAQESEMKTTLDEVCNEAERHGIGVIVVESPENYATWDERVVAKRTEPAPERLNDFIALQLSEGSKEEIVQWFK
jgi:hypothetical protein